MPSQVSRLPFIPSPSQLQTTRLSPLSNSIHYHPHSLAFSSPPPPISMKKGSNKGSHKGGDGNGKYTSIMHSEQLVKSTSEEDIPNRESSSSAASPTYASDRGSTTDNYVSSELSSPFAMSPWNNHASSSPWSANPFSEDSNARAVSSGISLVGSLVREEGHIYSLAPFGDLLYTGSDSKNIRVWKDQNEYAGFKSTSGLVKSIVISTDHLIFTGHQDGKIRVWCTASKNPKGYKRTGTFPKLKDILRSSLNSKKRVCIRHSDAISTLCLSEDQTLLYSGSWDRTVKVWRIKDSKCVESINAHNDAVNVVVNGFDSLLLTGSADGTVKVWKREAAAKGKTRHVEVQALLRQESAVTSLVVDPLTGVVYSGSSDGAVNLWEKGLVHGGVLSGHKLAVLCLATAGSLLFSGSADKTICMWGRGSNGAHVCLSVLTGHGGPIKCLVVGADPTGDGAGAGRSWLLYSGSLDKSVKIWKVSDATDHQQRIPSSNSSSTNPPKFDMY